MPPFEENKLKYTTLRLTPEQARELKKQSVSEIMSTSVQGDGTLSVSPRYPTEGSLHGREFKIRQNINVLVKCLAQKAFREGQGLDMMAFEQVRQDMLTAERTHTKEPERIQGLIQALDVPQEYVEDFTSFCYALNTEGRDYIFGEVYNGLSSMVDGIRGYNILKSDENSISWDNVPEKDRKADIQPAETRRAMLEESEDDYRQAANALRNMANMNPEFEERILNPMETVAFGSVMRNLICFHNNLCVEKDRQNSLIDSVPSDTFWDSTLYIPQVPEEQTVGPRPVITDNSKEDPEKGVYCVRSMAAPFVIPLTLDGQSKRIVWNSLDTNDVKHLACGLNGPVSTGVFSDEKAMENHFQSKAVQKMPDYNLRTMSQPRPTRGNPADALPWGLTVPDMMKNVQKTILDTDSIPEFKNSTEYKAFRAELAAFRKDMEQLGTSIMNQERFTEHLNKSKLVQTAKAYADYCAAHPKTGSRRETRLNAANQILDCAAALKANRSPLEYSRDKMLDNLYKGMEDHARKTHGNDRPYNKPKTIAHLRKTEAVQEFLMKNPVDKLTRLANMNPDKLLGVVALRDNEMKKEKQAAAQKRAEARARAQAQKAKANEVKKPQGPVMGKA